MSLSLNDLDAAQKSSEAFEFEYQNANGDPTGIFLSVVGSQAEKVTSAVAKLVNERRRKEAAREVQRRLQPNARPFSLKLWNPTLSSGSVWPPFGWSAGAVQIKWTD